MFVINFDFSQQNHIRKLLAINLPICITELLTYPLQRVQTLLLVKKQYMTKNQFMETRLILRQLIYIQRFPQLLRGVRYSIDYSITQMTCKFFLFDYLISKHKQLNSYSIYFLCAITSMFSTIVSQISMNYQVLSSSFAVNRYDTHEHIRNQLVAYTNKHRQKLPLIGLKYTLPVGIMNTFCQVTITQLLNKNNTQKVAELMTAFFILVLTSFPSHYAFQRQVQTTLNLKIRLPFIKGLLGTITRHTIRGITLYWCYLAYFQMSIKLQLKQLDKTRDSYNKIPQYRQNPI